MGEFIETNLVWAPSARDVGDSWKWQVNFRQWAIIFDNSTEGANHGEIRQWAEQ